MNENYRIIERTERVYSIIPITPLVEGHSMVLPVRHTLMEDLFPEELIEINEMLSHLKNKLVELYPLRHPIIATLSDTKHASIPGHVHYHLIPSEVNMRGLMAAYDSSISINKKTEIIELERMAKLLRGEQ